jgi:XTP/dITP diphosphohydrolase
MVISPQGVLQSGSVSSRESGADQLVQEIKSGRRVVNFESLPQVIRGESKDVRYLGHGLVAIRFRPTIYSFTSNRCEEVPGSERIRLETCKTFLKVLTDAGISHAYQAVLPEQGLVISRLVMPTDAEFSKYNTAKFIPDDLSAEQIDKLPKAPPIEVVIKNTHTGTSKHRYIGMNGATVRSDHPTLAGARIVSEAPYPQPLVRFDWRNPLLHPQTGARAADEILSERTADYFLNVDKARHTALRVNLALSEFLGARDIVLYDLCLFVAQDGELVYGEISPDCGRFRHFFLGSLDKDVWRSGGSSAQVLDKWQLLAEHIKSPPCEPFETYVIPQNRNSELRLSLGTSNPHKVAEFAAILDPLAVPLEVITAPEPDETGSTFLDNARIKALEYAKASGRMVISEDSGLVVPALRGLPGVYSARFSDCEFAANGELMSHRQSDRSRYAIDAVNNEKLLNLMSNFDGDDRKAWFEIALVVASPDGHILYESTAKCHGAIASEARGEHGFGYDSLFIGDRTDGATFAELDAQRKNLRSHRRKVLGNFSAWMCDLIRKQQDNVIVIDGNDGVGKSTVVERLKALGWRVKDRGAATQLTDNPNASLPETNEISFILDAPVEISRQRLERAGRDLNEQYHTVEDLTKYRERFNNVAQQHPGLFRVVDAAGSVEETLKSIIATLYGPPPGVSQASDRHQ